MNYPYKIQALKDYPNDGNVLKGEIGIYTGVGNMYHFPSQRGYYVGNLAKSSYKILQQEKEIIYEIY